MQLCIGQYCHALLLKNATCNKLTDANTADRQTCMVEMGSEEPICVLGGKVFIYQGKAQ